MTRPSTPGGGTDSPPDGGPPSDASETSSDPPSDGGTTAETDGAGRDAATDDADRTGEAPPSEFRDGEGRRIAVTAYDGEHDPLVEMYEAFGPEDRAQGIPPADEESRVEWLDHLLSGGLNVVAWHGGTAVGHAALMPMEDGTSELAIFVAPDYRCAGIGSSLLGTLLEHGRANGVERVWLTVERQNRAAISLYSSFGFRTVERRQELEMELDL